MAAAANLVALARLPGRRWRCRAWLALDGHGIMLKSEIDVAEDIAAGRLERVLPDWDGGEAPTVALYPSAQHLPLKTRVLLDALADHIDGTINADRRQSIAGEGG